MCLFPVAAAAQFMPDQIWLHGRSGLPQNDYGNAVLRFENNLLFIQEEDLRMNFESTMAAATDSTGRLLFYTNGCYIANADKDTMLNGEGINPGEMHLRTCSNTGYCAPMGAMILALPEHPHLYYLFHMGIRYDAAYSVQYGPFYYSVIDMSLDGGKGAVISKNNIIADGNFEPFTAVRHGNGRDWWLVFPEYGSSRYFKILFSPQGIQNYPVQEMDKVMACRSVGMSCFSPNGIRYARQQNCGVVVMDFERCNGSFSHEKFIPLPPNAFGGGGVAFTKNGERLFVTTQLSLQAADLSESSPQFDTIVTTSEIAGASLHLMQRGPDSKIYISNLGRAKYYHAVTNPENAAIGFQRRWYDLAAYTVRTLPNYPNFRLYDLQGGPCDTLGINGPISRIYLPDAYPAVEIRPNPAQDVLRLYSVSGMETLRIFDTSGKAVFCPYYGDGEELILQISHLPRGMYFVAVGFGDRIWTGKFLIDGGQ